MTGGAGKARSSERFLVLDGLRGAAALLIITDHVLSPTMMAMFPGRYLAVDFFFVLSGFVLAHVYGERLCGGASPWAFLRARVIRFYPLYVLGLLIAAPYALLAASKGWNPYSAQQVLTSLGFGLFMTPAPPGLSMYPDAPYPLDGPFWTLFLELLINLVFALLAPRLTRVLLGFLIVGAALVLIPLSLGFGVVEGGHTWGHFYAGFPRVTFSFFTGVALYGLRQRWRAPPLPAWAALVVLLGALAFPGVGENRAVSDLAAVLLVFPALVLFAADTPVKGALAKVCAGMGLASYGIYILHVPMWQWIHLILARFLPEGRDLPGLANVAIVAVVATAAALILHRLYDEPARRWLMRMTARS